MINKNILHFILNVFLLFNLLQNAHAADITTANIKQMPQYTATFTLPSLPFSSFSTLVLRFYQAYGDGSRTGWQSNVTPPTVIYQGNVYPINTFFSYHTGNYIYGSYGLGYDQFAEYYGTNIAIEPNHTTALTITGTFQQVAYLSATLYMGGTQLELLDREMKVAVPELNPYIKNHPSVFAYPVNNTPLLTPLSENTFPLNKPNFNHPFVDPQTGKIDVYRLDQQESKQVVADDIAPDGCSRAYLFAQKNLSQEMIILRIKVPNVFIDGNRPDKIFHQYQTRYLSVGAHEISSETLLDFWTVNAEMLRDYMDADGYAYVFFASNTYTQQLAIQQNTPHTQPPVMTWGHYKGYLLGDPNFAIIIRYRDPNKAWQGSPENAVCYATPNDLKPVTAGELGEYLPEIYGDTLDHFNKGHIGIIAKNRPWPTK